MKINFKLLTPIYFLSLFLFFSCTNPSSAPAEESTETEESAETTEEPTPVGIVYVKENVADYASWKAAFDQGDSTRSANALSTIGVAQGQEDPNRVHLALNIYDKEKVKAFAESDAVKKIRDEQGITDQVITYLTAVDVDTADWEDMNRLVVMHDVADFDAWKSAYDDHKQARDDNGIVQRALLRGSDNPNMICLIFGYSDREKLDAFMASDDLKAKMEEAGVVGEPSMEMITWVELNN